LAGEGEDLLAVRIGKKEKEGARNESNGVRML